MIIMSKNGENGNQDVCISLLEKQADSKVAEKLATVEVKKAPPKPASSELFYYIHIGFFAMLGCLARIGIDKCFGDLAGIENSSQIVNKSFFSNMMGSFVLGAVSASPLGKTRLAAMAKGITTGFCGSFTTWSKWNQQQSLTLIGESSSTAQMQVTSICAWFVGFHAFIGSYVVGLDFGKDIGDRIGVHVSKNAHKIADYTVSFLLFLGFCGFIAGTIADQSTYGTRIWLAVICAPFGACLRHFLSRFNSKVPKLQLPLGTMMANCLGATVLACLHIVDTRVTYKQCPNYPGENGYNQGWNWNHYLCWSGIVTYAVGTGFCACLTTISTFMSEIVKIRNSKPVFAYLYAFLTVAFCQIVCGIINGVNHNTSVETFWISPGINGTISGRV